MVKKKKEIILKIEVVSNGEQETDEVAINEFVDSLIDTFKEKCALLEAKRIVNAKYPNTEINLILSNEENIEEYKFALDMNQVLD